MLRSYPPQENRQAIDCLLLEVWQSTGRYYDKQVARLLSNAFEAVDSKKGFTEDQIKKHRQRYVMPRIEEYLVSHPPPPGAHPGAPDSAIGGQSAPLDFY